MVNQLVVNNLRQMFGKNIKKFRESKKMTVYAASKKTGLTISQIQSIEKGESAYTVDSLIKLCFALNYELKILDPESGEYVRIVPLEKDIYDFLNP